MWSDAVGVTGEDEDFTGQDRHLLSNTTVFSLAKDLASMTHAQRVNAYSDLIRFLGVLFADPMRAIARAEEIADEEVLLQVTTGGPVPSAAPHLTPHVEAYMEYEGEAEVNQTELEVNLTQDAWEDVEVEINESEMVEGWWEPDMAQNIDPFDPHEDRDTCSHMQVAARVGPTTVFASYLARLQAHFESMTKPQRENIIDFLHQKLNAWREKWVMSLTSVSRDRADRLWALLVTYQGEATCIQANDAQWAEERWAEVVDMLQIDAVQAADLESFRRPPPSEAVVVEDTQAQEKGERASSSGDVLVRRKPEGDWEKATESEKAELERHDADLREEERRQAEHDEHVWTTHQASRAREWDEWALQTEMSDPSRTRPLKKFKVRVAVKDAEQNELATADLTGEVEPNDKPQITIEMHEEIVLVPNEDHKGENQEGETDQRKQDEEATGNEGEGAVDADQAETVAATTRGEEDIVDEEIDADISDLGDIMESVMGRQWFQLFVDGQVDAEMVRKRWGATTLEVFQVNKDMMELMEAMEADKGKSAAERLRESPRPEGDLVVRHMDSDDGSSRSSGAKDFPLRSVVAGRRDEDEEAADRVDEEGEEIPNKGEEAGRESDDREAQQSNSTHQQALLDTQLEEEMDVEDAGAGHLAGTSCPTAGSGTTSAAGSTEGDGSFGDGKVQADLEGWLRRGN